MRLIDADALIHYICNEVPLKYFMGRDINKANMNMLYILKCISTQKTIISDKKGNWEIHEDIGLGALYCECSLCKQKVMFSNKNRMNYCPYCGSRMEEISEEQSDTVPNDVDIEVTP